MASAGGRYAWRQRLTSGGAHGRRALGGAPGVGGRVGTQRLSGSPVVSLFWPAPQVPVPLEDSAAWVEPSERAETASGGPGRPSWGAGAGDDAHRPGRLHEAGASSGWARPQLPGGQAAAGGWGWGPWVRQRPAWWGRELLRPPLQWTLRLEAGGSRSGGHHLALGCGAAPCRPANAAFWPRPRGGGGEAST